MLLSSAKEIMNAFQPSLLDEAKAHTVIGANTSHAAAIQFGMTAILEGTELRSVRTSQLAKDCGTGEGQLFRKFGRPVVENIIKQAAALMNSELLEPRRRALTGYATRLALDKEVSFTTALSSWSQAYGAIAKPAATYDIALTTFPDSDFDAVNQHAVMVTDSVNLLALRHDIAVPDRLIKGLVLPATAAMERADEERLGQNTEMYIRELLGQTSRS